MITYYYYPTDDGRIIVIRAGKVHVMLYDILNSKKDDLIKHPDYKENINKLIKGKEIIL